MIAKGPHEDQDKKGEENRHDDNFHGSMQGQAGTVVIIMVMVIVLQYGVIVKIMILFIIGPNQVVLLELWLWLFFQSGVGPRWILIQFEIIDGFGNEQGSTCLLQFGISLYSNKRSRHNGWNWQYDNPTDDAEHHPKKSPAPFMKG